MLLLEQQQNGLVDTHERVKYQLRTISTLSKLFPAFKTMKKLKSEERTAPTFRISPIDSQTGAEQLFDGPTAEYQFPVIQDEEYMFKLNLVVQYRVQYEGQCLGLNPATAGNTFTQNQRQTRRSNTIPERPVSTTEVDLLPRYLSQRRHSSPIPIHKKKIDISKNLKVDYFPSSGGQSGPAERHSDTERQPYSSTGRQLAPSSTHNVLSRETRASTSSSSQFQSQSNPEPKTLSLPQQPRGRSMIDEQYSRQRQGSLDNADTGFHILRTQPDIDIVIGAGHIPENRVAKFENSLPSNPMATSPSLNSHQSQGGTLPPMVRTTSKEIISRFLISPGLPPRSPSLHPPSFQLGHSTDFPRVSPESLPMHFNARDGRKPDIGGITNSKIEMTPPFGAMIALSPSLNQEFVCEVPPPFTLDGDTTTPIQDIEGSESANYAQVRRKSSPCVQSDDECNYELPFSVPNFSLEALATGIKWGLESPPPSPRKSRGSKGRKKTNDPSPLVPEMANSSQKQDDSDEVLFPFAFENSNDTAGHGDNAEETFSIAHVIELCRSPPPMNFSPSIKGGQNVQNGSLASSPLTLASFKQQLAKFTLLREEFSNTTSTDRPRIARSSSIGQDYIVISQ